MDVMGPFHRWRALTWPAQRLVLASALAVGAAAAGLRLAGVRRALHAASFAPHGRPFTPEQIRDRVIAVARAGRYVPGGSCLAQSLALAWMLRRHGLAATVRVGVRTAGGFDAHAWVECDGVALNDAWRPGGRYAPFDDVGSLE